MPTCPAQLQQLQSLVHLFSKASGLKVNYHKSSLLPINVSEEVVQHLSTLLGCAIGTFPFIYLGTPLGFTKPKMEFFMYIIERIQKRLTICSQYLSYDGRLLMINAVLSSLPTFLMSCLLLYKGIIEQIDKYIRHLFWRGKDLEKKNPPLAAWDMICRPKDKGGLGILNLHTQNTYLLMKMVHKFLNHYDIPWVHLIWEVYYQQGVPSSNISQCSFWWRDFLKLLNTYKSHATCFPQDGKTIGFWQEAWDEIPKSQLWPHLYSFSKQQQISLHEIVHTEDMSDHFHLPLSEEAYEEYLQLEQCLQDLNLNENHDIWQFTPVQVIYKVYTAYTTLTIAQRSYQPSSGYGKLVANLSTRYSFGY